MSDLVTLLAKVNERFAAFVRNQTEEQLLAFADGRLCLSFMEHVPTAVHAPHVAADHLNDTGVPPMPSKPRKKSAPAKAAPTAVGRASTKKQAAKPDLSERAAKIAQDLRSLSSEADGAALLTERRATVDLLLAIGKELGLTLSKTNKADLTQKVLSQAIGARQKFAGLRAW